MDGAEEGRLTMGNSLNKMIGPRLLALHVHGK